MITVARSAPHNRIDSFKVNLSCFDLQLLNFTTDKVRVLWYQYSACFGVVGNGGSLHIVFWCVCLLSWEWPVRLSCSGVRCFTISHSAVAPWWRICLPVQETWVLSLGQEDPLEKEVGTHSSTLAWESHGQRSQVGYSLWGRKKVGRDLVNKQQYGFLERHRFLSWLWNLLAF